MDKLLKVALFTIFIAFVFLIAPVQKISAQHYPSCNTYNDCPIVVNGQNYFYPCLNNTCSYLSCQKADSSIDPSICTTYGANTCINGVGYYNGNAITSGYQCLITGSTNPPAPQPSPTPAPTPQPAPVPAPTSTPPANNTVEESKPAINTVTLPDRFKLEGSMTTDFSKISNEDASSFVGLTFDVPGSSSIKFNDPVDLTNAALIEKLKEINNYIILERGQVIVDSEVLTQFKEISASLIMYDVFLDPSNIVILKDGVEVTDDMVSSVNYDANTKILSFDVKGFSTYEVIENGDDTVLPVTPIVDDSSNNMVLIGIIGAVLLVALVIAIMTVNAVKKKGSHSSDTNTKSITDDDEVANEHNKPGDLM